MSETFTKELARNYKKACRENSGVDHDSFYCAKSKGRTKRNLNLSSNYVFCEKIGSSKKDRPEYRLEAYMVKKALQDKRRLLPIKYKSWEFIDAERNFAKADIVKGAKKLDILAYEEKTNTYIILELKVKRTLSRAEKELKRYCKALKNHIDDANNVYNKRAKNVSGYIVWPSLNNQNHAKDDTKMGLIEYRLKDLEALKNNTNISINFEIKKEPKCD